jgi:putative peptidoglycan lipid II flippase
VLQFLALWLACALKGAPVLPMRPRMTPEMRKLFLLMGPGVLAAGIQQINLLVGGIIASFQENGISFIYASERVYQLPLGMIGISLGVVLLPEVTRQLRAGDEKAASESIMRGMELGLLVTVPAAVAMMVIPVPLIATLFERGNFTAMDSVQTGYALAGFAVGLPGYVLIKVLQPGFFAREDTRSPMIMAGITVAVNIICSVLLFLLLRPYGFGHVGIAISTSIAAWVNVYLLWRGLNGFVKTHRRDRKKLFRMLVASLLMGVVVWLGWQVTREFFDGSQWHRVGVLALLIGVGVTLYGWLVLKLKVTTFADLKEGFGR